jgi:V8-like Glu-specific endopeptidase
MKVYPHSVIGALTCRDKTGYLVKTSGALISQNLVVTAAHAIFNRK